MGGFRGAAPGGDIGKMGAGGKGWKLAPPPPHFGFGGKKNVPFGKFLGGGGIERGTK